MRLTHGAYIWALAFWLGTPCREGNVLCVMCSGLVMFIFLFAAMTLSCWYREFLGMDLSHIGVTWGS